MIEFFKAKQEIDALLDRTIEAIVKNQKALVSTFFAEAENLYIKGNTITRMLMGNEYVYKVSTYLENGKNHGGEFLALLPNNLKKLYCNQLEN